MEYEVENAISDEECVDIYSSNVENGINENDSENAKTTAKKHQDFCEKTEKKI